MSWYKLKQIGFFIGGLMALHACQTKEKLNPKIYFDSEAYLAAEWSNLEKMKYAKQEVVFNEESEELDSILVDSASLKEYFKLFEKANINNAIYIGEYLIDTFWLENPESGENLMAVNYHTTNSDLPVQWFHVFSDGSVHFKMTESNFLFFYEKEVSYQPNEGFRIISKQKSLWQDTMHIAKTFVFI
jgi:hypothetical protein